MISGDVVGPPGGLRHVVRELVEDRVRLWCGRLAREWSREHPRGVQILGPLDERAWCGACREHRETA